MNLVRFTVPFAPVAKARARTTWTNQGPRHYTPEATSDWERTVALYAKQAMRGHQPIQGPLALAIDFYLPITTGWPLWKRQAAAAGDIAPTLKPDLDNFVKAVKDACNGITWGDDSQICRMTSSKGYALTGRVEVSVLLLDHLQPAQVSRRPLPKPVEA